MLKALGDSKCVPLSPNNGRLFDKQTAAAGPSEESLNQIDSLIIAADYVL